MDLSKFEYQKAECVMAFQIVALVPTVNRMLPNFLLLDSGVSNMPFAVGAPMPVTSDDVGKYFIMHDDGNYDILTETEFNLEYMPKP
jgi:hypothetical protein